MDRPPVLATRDAQLNPLQSFLMMSNTFPKPPPLQAHGDFIHQAFQGTCAIAAPALALLTGPTLVCKGREGLKHSTCQLMAHRVTPYHQALRGHPELSLTHGKGRM